MGQQIDSTPAAPPAVPSWFANAKMGMFIHWGLYSVLGHGEQSLFREFRPPSEYRRLAGRFRAERYDPDVWAALAKAAGMRYMVLTTKHHDGYCLWDTATTDFNAARTGAGRGLVQPFVTACRRAGLAVGLYFSLPDWSVPGFFAGPQRDPAGYRRFIRITWAQIEELMSNYGRIDLLWFDCGQGKNAFPTAGQLQSTRLVEMIRKHQPGILINNRLPKPRQGGDWGYATPEQRIGLPPGAGPGQVWESCVTSTRSFWGYHVCHEDPSMWYTQRELLTFLVRCICGGGNLLLNVGPYPSGELPKPFMERSRELGQWLRRNRKAVYGTEPFDTEFSYGGCVSRKGNRLYLFFLYWPGREFSLPGFEQKLLSARLIAPARKVAFTQEPHRILLRNLPRKAPDPQSPCSVVELRFAGPPTPHPWARHRLHRFPMPEMEEWLKL